MSVPVPRRPVAAALDTLEAATYLSIERSTLKRWRVTGKGPAYVRAGSKILYRVADLDDWLEAHLVGGGRR